jgi:Fe-S-cluster containining protein
MFPVAHRRLLPLVFDRPAIHEVYATCSDCAMCSKAAKAPAGGVFFKPNLKCCTYHPTLPNFLVGAILADESPAMAEGRHRVQIRIAQRIGVTPQWLAPPRKQRVLLEASRKSSFGRSKALLCPYFAADQGGICTIWQHREAVCSTFFCKHDAGAVGDAFWTAAKDLLGHVELVLARRAAQSASAHVTEPNIPPLELTIEDLEDRPPSEAEYASYWGEWVGREEEFYLDCHTFVSALGPADLDRILEEEADQRGNELLAELERRHDALSAPIAERLIPNPNMRVTKAVPPQSGFIVTTYSSFDSQNLTPDLFDVVHQFNENETVAEVRARLQIEHDLEIPDELLLSLQQHAILIPPGDDRG